MGERRPGLSRLRARAWTVLPVAVAVLVAAVVTGVVPFEPVRVPGDSMAPTLAAGDHLLLDRRAHVPARGELLVVADPLAPGALVVKRVAAVAGQQVGISDGVLEVDGLPVDEPYADRSHQQGVYFGPVVVPPGGLFLLGDNRADSVDSRHTGSVRAADVVGRVTVRLLPLPGRL